MDETRKSIESEDEGVVSDAELFDAIDMIISDAASATDGGNYRGALEGLRTALELMRVYYGETQESAELNNDLESISGLLDESPDGSPDK